MADNMSVVKNTSIPESVLKKKSNSIAYHYVRERAAAGMILVRHERTDSNIADDELQHFHRQCVTFA